MTRFEFTRDHSKDVDGESGPIFVNDNEDEDEPEVIRSRQTRRRQHEPSKKLYLAFFISTTIFVCFCVFVIVPQLIDCFTGTKAPTREVESSNSYASHKQSVIEMLDKDSAKRAKEKLEMMEKFDALQANYKRLLTEYKEAQDNYLDKLHKAIEKEQKKSSVKAHYNNYHNNNNNNNNNHHHNDNDNDNKEKYNNNRDDHRHSTAADEEDINATSSSSSAPSTIIITDESTGAALSTVPAGIAIF